MSRSRRGTIRETSVEKKRIKSEMNSGWRAMRVYMMVLSERTREECCWISESEDNPGRRVKRKLNQHLHPLLSSSSFLEFKVDRQMAFPSFPGGMRFPRSVRGDKVLLSEKRGEWPGEWEWIQRCEILFCIHALLKLKRSIIIIIWNIYYIFI